MAELPSAQDLFKGRHFDRDVIILCVRWYLTFKLSSRDLVQMMAERGIALVHTTILRWVQRYVPEFEKRWHRYALPVADSWRVAEMYPKVRGQRVCPYRAVDRQGRTLARLFGLLSADGTRGNPSGAFDRKGRRRIQLVVDVGVDEILALLAIHSSSFSLRSRNSSCSWSLARERRDITVPSGIPATSEISL